MFIVDQYYCFQVPPLFLLIWRFNTFIFMYTFSVSYFLMYIIALLWYESLYNFLDMATNHLLDAANNPFFS